MRQLQPGWRDQNKDRAYPFSDRATLRGSDGTAIPNALFADAKVYLVGGHQEAWISRIYTDENLVHIVVQDAAGMWAEGQSTRGQAVETMALQDPYGRPAGLLVFDTEQSTALSGFGDVRFARTALPFCAAAVDPVPAAGARSILCGETLFSDEVWIVAGPGVVWLPDPDTGGPQLNVVGDPYYARRECQDRGADFPEPRCFVTLNGLYPSAAGNVRVVSGTTREDSVLRVGQKDGGIYLYFTGGRSSV